MKDKFFEILGILESLDPHQRFLVMGATASTLLRDYAATSQEQWFTFVRNRLAAPAALNETSVALH